jgi:hypothetical protein
MLFRESWNQGDAKGLAIQTAENINNVKADRTTITPIDLILDSS